MRFIIRFFARILALVLTMGIIFLGIVKKMSELVTGIATSFTVICIIIALITKNWIGVGVLSILFLAIVFASLFAIIIQDCMENIRKGLLNY